MLLAAVAAFAPSTWDVGIDFTMRYNEMQCVRFGADPYEIAFGEEDSDGYKDLKKVDVVPSDHFLVDKDGEALINSYPPWAYTFLFPLHSVPPERANMLFNATSLGCYFLLLALAFWRVWRAKLPPAEGRLAVAAGGFLGLPLLRVLQVGNYGLFLALGAALFALALERKHDWLGGAAFALLMLKPHFGLPFAVPLLFKGKWKPLLAGGLFCFAASIPPAVFTGQNVFSMILHTAHSGAASIHSDWLSTGFFSPPVFRAFAWCFGGTGGALAASMALGAIVLSVASWRMRKEENWWLQLVPPAMVACLWSMGHAHDHVLLSPAIATLALAAFARDGREKHFVAGTVLLAAEFWLFAVVAACAAAWAVSGGGGMGLSSGLEATRVAVPRAAYTAYLQVVSVLQAFWLFRWPRTRKRDPASGTARCGC